MSAEHRAALEDAVEGLSAAVTALNEASTAAGLAAFTAEELIGLLRETRIAARASAAIDATWVTTLYLTAEHGDVEVPGIGKVSIRRSKDRKEWDHHGLGRAVVDAHMEERAGEIPDPTEVAGWVLDAAAPSYWRVTKLRDLGIEPKELGMVEEKIGKPGVTIPLPPLLP